MSKHAKQQAPFLTLGASLLALLLTVSGVPASMAAGPASSVNLGTAANFAVLAGSGITNAGNTTISGPGSNMGSHPNGAFTGHGTVTVPAGAIKYLEAHPVTSAAKADLARAFAEVKGRNGATLFSSGPARLLPGLYKTTTTFALAAGEVLTLDAADNSNAIFVFQIGTDLSLAANSRISLINGAQAKNVFWQVSTSATFAANASFAGTVMAYAGITVADGASFQGQLLAITSAVTLINSRLTNNSSAEAASPAAPTPPAGNAPTATATARPSGNALIGSVLVNAVSFSGTPSPVTTYSWQSSPNGTSGWTTISGATGSTFRLADDQVGDYVRSVVTAKNDSGTVTQTSPATNRILPPAPARPVLASASDSGSNSFDGVTSVNRPSLSMAGLVVGSEVIVTATKGNLQETCRLTARSSFASCVFPRPLADGTWVLSGNNVLSDVPSDSSGSLFITIDTTAPAVGAFTADQGSLGTSVLTHSLSFDEVVTGLSASDFTLVSTTVTCDSPTLSGFGTNYTVTSANCRGDGTVQMRLKSDAAQDLAGNSGPSYAFMTAHATRTTSTSSTTPESTTGTEAAAGSDSSATTGTGTTTGSGSSAGTGSSHSSTQATTSVTEDTGISSETVESTATEASSQEAELQETQSADGKNDSADQDSGSGGWNWWLIIGLVIGTIFGGAAIFLMRRRLV